MAVLVEQRVPTLNFGRISRAVSVERLNDTARQLGCRRRTKLSTLLAVLLKID